MAFDLLSGKQGGRDWSRGTDNWDHASPWVQKFAAREAGKIPVTPLIIGLGAVTTASLALILLSGKHPKAAKGYHRRVTEPTIQIPHESMREVVYGKR